LNSNIYTLKRKHGTIERSVLVSADSAITKPTVHVLQASLLKAGWVHELKAI